MATATAPPGDVIDANLPYRLFLANLGCTGWLWLRLETPRVLKLRLFGYGCDGAASDVHRRR